MPLSVRRLQFFGGLTVEQGDRRITRFPTAKTAALLAYLALFSKHTHPREELADLLWPEADTDAARANLRQALASLRRLLEPPGTPAGSILITDRSSVRLDPATFETDVAAFEAALACATRAATPEERLAHLQSARDFYIGDFLPGFYDDWVIEQRERLLLAHEEAEAQRQELSRVLVSSRESLPTGQEGQGDSAPAPGMSPLPSSPASLRTDRVRLPLQFTRYFGREDERALVQRLLDDPGVRLVTLTGAGGAGKTRLAVECGRHGIASFPGALYFVPLSDLSDPALIADAILSAVGAAPMINTPPLEQVAAALRGRAVLLLLDNLEQFGDGAAPIVLALLSRLPGLKILATSRHRLFVAGERELHLPPLPTPEADEGSLAPERLLDFPAVALFVNRAQLARSDFQITPRNAPAVAALCRRLEGIPLAIELAAAWAQTLTPAQMLARLSERLDALLFSRRKDVDERHQTLRAAIGWSYDLLPADLPRFWSRLSVFRGGWTVEAAQDVCEETQALHVLALLRSRSLVIVEEAGDLLRYRMLEPLREFAWEQIEPAGRAGLSRRHADYFLTWAERAAPKLKGREQDIWLEHFDAEHDNLRAALDGNAGTADQARLAVALVPFWDQRGHLHEARGRLAEAVSRFGETDLTGPQARALVAAAFLARRQGDHARSRPLSERALASFRRLGDAQGQSEALSNLGQAANDEGDYARAEALLRESLALRRETGDAWEIAMALNNSGLNALCRGDYAYARACHDESLALRRQNGDWRGIAASLCCLATIAMETGDYAQACALQEQALTINRKKKNKRQTAISLNNLANATYLNGDRAASEACRVESLGLFRELGDSLSVVIIIYNSAEAARRHQGYACASALYREAIGLAREMGNIRQMTNALQGLAYLDIAQGRFLEGTRLLGAVGAARVAHQIALRANYQADYDQHLAQAHTALGENGFAAAWAEGLSLPLAAAVASVLDTVAGLSRSLNGT